MKKNLFGGIMILFVLGMIASQGNAQNAWVLWQKYESANGNDRWIIIGAYPSYNSCLQTEEAMCTTRASQFSEFGKDVKCFKSWGGHAASGEFKEGGLFIFDWKCLPDTIDPSGQRR